MLCLCSIIFSASCRSTDNANSPNGSEKIVEKDESKPQVVFVSPARRDVTITVELAIDAQTQARGLMYRESLGEYEGMLFIYNYDADHSFWMKNTLIPLDMVFIRADGAVAGIVENAEPQTLTSRSVGAPSRYVLEVNGGFCKQHGVSTSSEVKFVDIPQAGD